MYGIIITALVVSGIFGAFHLFTRRTTRGAHTRNDANYSPDALREAVESQRPQDTQRVTDTLDMCNRLREEVAALLIAAAPSPGGRHHLSAHRPVTRVDHAPPRALPIRRTGARSA